MTYEKEEPGDDNEFVHFDGHYRAPRCCGGPAISSGCAQGGKESSGEGRKKIRQEEAAAEEESQSRS